MVCGTNKVKFLLGGLKETIWQGEGRKGGSSCWQVIPREELCGIAGPAGAPAAGSIQGREGGCAYLGEERSEYAHRGKYFPFNNPNQRNINFREVIGVMLLCSRYGNTLM